MTRKDFELIAGVINAYAPESINEGFTVLQLLAEDLADALAGTNDRFNRETFLTACGVK